MGRGQVDGEGRAEASPGTFGADRSAMKVHDCLGNRQAQSQSVGTRPLQPVSTFKGVENERQCPRVDPHPGVFHRQGNFPGFGIGRAHGDESARAGKLDRVLEKVPKHLMKSGSITIDMMLSGIQFKPNLN